MHKLLIILEGRIKKFRSANLLAQTGQYWGDQYLEGGEMFNKDAKLEDDIIVETESVLIEISLDSVRNAGVYKEERKKVLKMVETRKIGTEKLQWQKVLGQGEFSSVHLFLDGKEAIVGKVYNKTVVDREDYSRILMQHVDVVERVQHVFVPRFYQVLN